jgi:hypothetical protein
MKVFAKDKSVYNGFATPFNSPLTPMIKKGLLSLLENGMNKNLRTKWEGDDIADLRGLDTMVLSLGHTILVYFIIATTTILSIVVLIIELIYKKYLGHFEFPIPNLFELYFI